MKRLLAAATLAVFAVTGSAAAWPPVCKPAIFYELTGICL